MLTLSLLAAGIVGCTSKPNTESTDPNANVPANAGRSTPEDKAALVASQNQFALDLLSKLDKKDNLFFSPASITPALAMTYAGARGQTAEQMKKVLHFTLDSEHLHPAFAALSSELYRASQKGGCKLSIANALWGDKSTSFLPEFRQLMKDNYGAGLQQVDFAMEADARKAINDWVSKQTAERIKDFLKSGDLTPDTRLVLTNAIYFKGDWEHAFPEKSTRDNDFHVNAKEKVSVPMMHQVGEFGYFADDLNTFQMLAISYKGSDLTMAILLPREVDGLKAFEENLTAEKLAEWRKGVRRSKVQVSLPKFTMMRRLDLAGQLQALGMTDAFSAEMADFSGMTGDKKLLVSKVLHEAWVEVNEKGTEAAAATGVALEKKGDKAYDPIVFQADHPFLFLIRDSKSGNILFLGRMTNPKS
jgi:serpin B